MPKADFAALFRNANPDALDLLDRMLAFDPSRRISVEEALEHRYLSIWHDASDEPSCPSSFDFTFEVVEDVGEMRRMIYEEVKRFRQHVRVQPSAPVPQMHVAQGGMPGQPGSNQGVPLPPEGYERMREDPRPEDPMNQGMGLEHDLQRGLDGHGR